MRCIHLDPAITPTTFMDTALGSGRRADRTSASAPVRVCGSTRIPGWLRLLRCSHGSRGSAAAGRAGGRCRRRCARSGRRAARRRGRAGARPGFRRRGRALRCRRHRAAGGRARPAGRPAPSGQRRRRAARRGRRGALPDPRARGVLRGGRPIAGLPDSMLLVALEQGGWMWWYVPVALLVLLLPGRPAARTALAVGGRGADRRAPRVRSAERPEPGAVPAALRGAPHALGTWLPRPFRRSRSSPSPCCRRCSGCSSRRVGRPSCDPALPTPCSGSSCAGWRWAGSSCRPPCCCAGRATSCSAAPTSCSIGLALTYVGLPAAVADRDPAPRPVRHRPPAVRAATYALVTGRAPGRLDRGGRGRGAAARRRLDRRRPSPHGARRRRGRPAAQPPAAPGGPPPLPGAAGGAGGRRRPAGARRRRDGAPGGAAERAGDARCAIPDLRVGYRLPGRRRPGRRAYGRGRSSPARRRCRARVLGRRRDRRLCRRQSPPALLRGGRAPPRRCWSRWSGCAASSPPRCARSRRAGPGCCRRATPSAAGWSGTCTTAPSSGWSRWAWPCGSRSGTAAAGRRERGVRPGRRRAAHGGRRAAADRPRPAAEQPRRRPRPGAALAWRRHRSVADRAGRVHRAAARRRSPRPRTTWRARR